MPITWSEVSRGVPRSPNRHLDQFRVLRQFEIGGLQIQFNGFSNVGAGLLLGFASGRATGEFGAYRRVVAGLGIMFQNDSERHSNSIGQREFRMLLAAAAPRPASDSLMPSQTVRAQGARTRRTVGDRSPRRCSR